MKLNCIKSFTVELDGSTEAAFIGGEVVSGLVVLELRKDTRVTSMKVQGRGVAVVHWLEDRGMNSVYNDYRSKITYFRKGQHLIRGQCGLYLFCPFNNLLLLPVRNSNISTGAKCQYRYFSY